LSGPPRWQCAAGFVGTCATATPGERQIGRVRAAAVSRRLGRVRSQGPATCPPSPPVSSVSAGAADRVHSVLAPMPAQPAQPTEGGMWRAGRTRDGAGPPRGPGRAGGPAQGTREQGGAPGARARGPRGPRVWRRVCAQEAEDWRDQQPAEGTAALACSARPWLHASFSYRGRERQGALSCLQWHVCLACNACTTSFRSCRFASYFCSAARQARRKNMPLAARASAARKRTSGGNRRGGKGGGKQFRGRQKGGH